MNQVGGEEKKEYEKEVKHSGDRAAGERRVRSAGRRSRCYYNPHPAFTTEFECSPLPVPLLTSG